MVFVKYLAGGFIFILLSIGNIIIQGGNVDLNQVSILPLAINLLFALVAFAIADAIFKSKR